MVSFLNTASFPHLPISKLWDGEAVFKTHPSQGCGFWVFSRNPQSCWFLQHCPPRLIYHILNFHLAPRRAGWCLKRPFGATAWKSDTAGTCWWRSAPSLGFTLVNPPLLHKEAVNQFHPANQKQELNGSLTRPLKQEAGDSPCSHQRGTDL